VEYFTIFTQTNTVGVMSIMFIYVFSHTQHTLGDSWLSGC